MQKLILILAALATLLGCGAPEPLPPPPVASTISAADLSGLLDESGYGGLHLPSDNRYAVPGHEWVARLAVHWRASAGRRGPGRPEANDCEDFARDLLNLARKAHALGSSDAGLACGEVWYDDPARQRHAVAVFVLRDVDGRTRPAAIEAETGAFRRLTDAERASATIRIF